LPDARALIIHGRMTIPTLETDRLRLRPPCEDDFAVYRAFYADADASHFYGGPLDEGRA
jgi:RimJ/RimL family protein N-acetyltransferase